jgi:hypothetical protein
MEVNDQFHVQAAYTTWQKTPVQHWKRRLRQTRAGLVTFEKINFRYSCVKSKHDSSAVQPSDSNKGTIPTMGMTVDE